MFVSLYVAYSGCCVVQGSTGKCKPTRAGVPLPLHDVTADAALMPPLAGEEEGMLGDMGGLAPLNCAGPGAIKHSQWHGAPPLLSCAPTAGTPPRQGTQTVCQRGRRQ